MKKRKAAVFFKRLLLAVSIAMTVLGVVYIVRNILNRAFLSNYNAGSYSEFPENIVSDLPFGENYIAPYNLGNVEYWLGDYQKAARSYRRALQDQHIPEEKECRIRINMALAILHTVDWDNLNLNDDEAVNAAVEALLGARGYLTEKNCASEEAFTYTGHSRDAERLRDDIDRVLQSLLDQYENPDQNNGGENSDNSDSNDSDDNSEDNSDGSSGSQTEEERREQERQEALESALDDQKDELKRDEGSITDDEGHVYSYKDGGDTAGYGEGTPW